MNASRSILFYTYDTTHEFYMYLSRALRNLGFVHI